MGKHLAFDEDLKWAVEISFFVDPSPITCSELTAIYREHGCDDVTGFKMMQVLKVLKKDGKLDCDIFFNRKVGGTCMHYFECDWMLDTGTEPATA